MHTEVADPAGWNAPGHDIIHVERDASAVLPLLPPSWCDQDDIFCTVYGHILAWSVGCLMRSGRDVIMVAVRYQAGGFVGKRTISESAETRMRTQHMNDGACTSSRSAEWA